MFSPPLKHVHFPSLEEEILSFWREERVYDRSLEQRADAEPFIFYEGPPTANGLPHPGHCLTRAIKDLFPRYKTMRGFHCERKGGWDTHGLPVEVEVCKELGIHTKEDIEQYGVEPFIQRCQQSVWRYMQEWETLTERLGFWIRLEEAYVTYHQSYVESVWWSLKRFFDRGLLYQGHKIVWWWAQGGTALSAGEVGDGYRDVADPSVYVRFPLVDEENTSLLVWTTTPWTLPSNQFAAVSEELEYVIAEDEETGERFVLAQALLETVAEKAKRSWRAVDTISGKQIIGKRYVPPFDYYYQHSGDVRGATVDGGEQHVAWRVLAADFVTTDAGTGVVHQAPAFGEDDFLVLQGEQARFVDGQGPPLICAVGPNGEFTSEAPDYEGRWVKEADRDIIRDLRARGVLLHDEQYKHSYPFCWRADEDPLIQYPRESWFIRTSQFVDRLLENNQQINWLPDHIQSGRFGKFLESNVDWALSRERYWGTPLPIWVCSETGRMEAVECYDELLGKDDVSGTEVWEQAKAANPKLPDDLRVHKPYIDSITYASPFADGARMQRVSEVIDCWYDSGAMPFAQWGYPHGGQEEFNSQFPAAFISEAIDQTRGWFYSLLAISTLLNSDSGETGGELAADLPHPFRNCIVLGLMLAEVWACPKKSCGERCKTEAKKCSKCGGPVERKIEKMSKKLRNYPEPAEIFDNHGADALRWFFFANQAPWSSILYSERAIRESSASFRLTLWNVHNFFLLNATAQEFFQVENWLDGDVGQLTPDAMSRAATYRPVGERGELDRWVLSELHRASRIVVERMDAYDNFVAAQQLEEFVELLSNWWLRRSRDRLWSSDNESTEKLDAAWTLYECLVTLTKLIAPFTPFLAEAIWRNLAGVFGERAATSVHLCDYPTGDDSVIDETLSEQMRLLRQIASLSRAARTNARIRTRQPLPKVEVVRTGVEHQDWLEAHNELLCKELNVKAVEYTTDADDYIEYRVHPNFKRLGPRVGRRMPALKKALVGADGGALLAEMNESQKIAVDVDGEVIELTNEDIEIRLQAREGWVAAGDRDCVVVISTEIDDALVREGIAKDFIRLIQERRKELDCEYTDRIVVGVVSPFDDAIVEHAEYIKNETLAIELTTSALDGVEPVERIVAGETVVIYVKGLRND